MSGELLGFGLREFREVDEGRVDVDEFDNAGRGLAVSFCSRSADDERSSSALFEEGALLPDAVVFSEVVAVVAPEDDDGVVGESVFFESIEHASDLGVDEGDAGVVGLESLAASEFVEAVIWDRVVVGEGGGGNVVAIILWRVG